MIGSTDPNRAPATPWWSQRATAIVFGLGFAKIPTLVVTPSAPMLKAHLTAWRRRCRARHLAPVDVREAAE
jgi:multidrug efflux pump